MQMTSFILFALVATVFGVLFVCNRFVKDSARNVLVSKWTLLIASYVFVLYADFRFAVILFAMTCTTWFFAPKRKWGFVGIVIPLLALSYFKYTNFFIDSFADIIHLDHKTLSIVLPIGISFYTFSAISYIMDVRKGKVLPRGLLDVALYLSFFPKLVSGPIQRSGDFFSQADNRREVGRESFSCGVQIFVFGLFKKIVLADRLSVFVDQVYATPAAFGSTTVLLAAIAYSLQIYLDFSGYSDMAIGIARVLGFNLPRNFNLPYLSHNVTELWKRWHISLSSWLLEYLYISLGGNRKGKARTYVNLVLTMLLGGLWHGANWTYIVWGLLHGFALAVHKAWMTLTGSPNEKAGSVPTAISIAVTFAFTTICWIFFRAESVSDACFIIRRIISFEAGLEQPYMWFFIAAVIVLVASSCAYSVSKKKNLVSAKCNMSAVEGFYPILNLGKFWHLVLFFMEIGLVLCLAYTGGSPFIYGQY